MHRKGQPLLLYNIWDAGSALAVVSTGKKAGAKALATSSWAVATAHGFGDGQLMPRDFMPAITQRIAACVTVPVTADFEGGYAVSPLDIEHSTAALLATGIAGLNFEDYVLGGAGLYSIAAQVLRIAAVRAACLRASILTFINARTDCFCSKSTPGNMRALSSRQLPARGLIKTPALMVFCPRFDGSTSDWARMRGLRNAGKYNAVPATNAD